MTSEPRDRPPSITLIFDKTGRYLTSICFNAETDAVYDALWKSLQRLTGTAAGWISRLFGGRR